MNKLNLISFVTLLFILSCSSGRKAMEKGDYFSAVIKSIQRLQSNPDNRKAASVLKESYPLAISWAQEEIDLLLTTNENFKLRIIL